MMDSRLLQSIPWLHWYVTRGGVYGVAIALFGSLLLGWGLLNLWTRNRKNVLIHLSLCWLPVVVSFLCCVHALVESFATANLKASGIIAAFVCGVAGPVGGFLPAMLAIIQLWRLESSE